jgi:hypothetical protein
VTQQTKVLQATIATIVGVVVVGGIFGAVWLPGVGLAALAALIALFVILSKGAEAMNEPGQFGQGLTSVLAALILLPAAIAAATFLGVAIDSADDDSTYDTSFYDDSSSGDSAYDECMVDPEATYEECEELE